jgi:hypothetical protein
MEYGEAVSEEALDRAVAIGRALLRAQPAAIETIAAIAVARAYCVCVTDGEDSVEQRLSDVHRTLIADVAKRLAAELPPISARKE